MAKNPDEVLAELKQVGALGGLPKPPVVPDVEIEQEVPHEPPLDPRGDLSRVALDDAVRYLDGAVREMTGLREALASLREVWEPVETTESPVGVPVVPPESLLSISKRVEGTSKPLVPVEPPEPTSDAPDEETVARARAAARRKILGEDIPEDELARLHGEVEEDVPFVGAERARMPGQEPQEITVGTVGRIKPSFPVEENDGT